MSKSDFANWDAVFGYAQGCIDGTILANKYRVLACRRFLEDVESGEWDFNPKDAEFCIRLIERTICHMQGEDQHGIPLRGKPFLLMDFHKFIIYNLLGFKEKGSEVRRFHESLIFLPRKNVKTSFSAALAWALGILGRDSGSKIYVVAAALKQTMETFDFLKYNIRNMGEDLDSGGHFKIMDNYSEHSLKATLGDGMMELYALAANPDAQDSLNCSVAIADEIHAFRQPKQYNLFKEAMKAYRNKLMIGISTAGDDPNSFLAQRLKYCKRVLDKEVRDDQYFIFICEADADENGNIDYTNPKTHEMANPAYGQSVQPAELLNDSLQALNDPQQRKDFLAKSLNIFTTSTKTYFDIIDVQASDESYSWTLEELAKLPIKWYGGADLSKMFDLTGVCLHGRYKDVDIVISHGFMPITQATIKADEDQIPFFWWQDMGWLSMCNSDVIEYGDVVKWFTDMAMMGFKIQWVGYDRRYAQEFVMQMKKANFRMRDQSQRYVEKTEAFREIEKQIKNHQFYYLHSKAFEYCIGNVRAIEDSDEFIRYEKVQPNLRIDLFDADVIACKQMLIDRAKSTKLEGWFGQPNKEKTQQ